MVRPKSCWRVRFKPKAYYYKPQGVPMRELEQVILTKEEMEAIKLKDYDGLEQIAAAEKMGASQSTFQRLLASARGKLASAIVEGQALVIEKNDKA